MGSGTNTTRTSTRGWQSLGLALFAIALLIGGLIAARHWLKAPDKDPMRLVLLQAALSEFQAGRFSRADAILDERAAATSPTPLDWMLRARVAEAQGRAEDALRHLKKIPDSDQLSSQAWLKAGQIELARHHAQAAEAAYRHALAINPDQVQAYRELAYLYAVQRRKAECDLQFRALIQRVAPDVTLAFAWNQNTCGLWDVPGAQKVLIPCVDAVPEDRTSRMALATSYALTGELDRAETILKPLLNSDPDACAVRVQISVDRGNLEVAEQLLQEAPPGHPRLDLFRGRLALHSNEPRRAAGYFRAVLRDDPTDRDAIQGLGVALQRLGDPQARQLLQLADRYDQLKRTIKDSVVTIQTDRKIFNKLGEICMALNRHEEARLWYRFAIDRDPLDSQAQQALDRLNRSGESTSTSNDPVQAQIN